MSSTKTSIGIKELAAHLGVSIGTVSRSLNNRYGVNAETRERVLDAAREYGYVPNSAARQLMARPALTVGLFFAPYYGPHGEINPSSLSIIEALRSHMQSQDIELQIFYYQNDQELRMQAKSVNVGIFFGRFEDATLEAVHAMRLPCVLYSRQSSHPDQLCVMPSARHSSALAVQYLAALNHERIALMTGPLVEAPYRGYREGFMQAMQEFRLKVNKDWLLELPASQCNKDGACAALLPLLQGKDARQRPSAVIFSSDWLAIGGRSAAREASLRVPEDLCLIGYDNLPLSAELDPPLTTFDIHRPDLVQTITRLVSHLGNITGNKKAISQREFLIIPDLIKRGSCTSLRPPL